MARRIARFGTGWIPWGPAASDLVTGIRQMREELAAIGHDATGLQVVGFVKTVRDDRGAVDVGRTMDAVPAMVDAGVTDVRTTVPLPDDAAAAADFLAGLVQAFRGVTGG